MADPTTYRPRAGEIPDSPGVYRFRDEHGRVIYVGKAKSLRQRLISYFADPASLHPRTQTMVTTAAGVDWTVVGTEVEALQLEYSWIKEFDPRFNVRYRDDKSYPFLAVTMAEEYPRVQVMRGAKRRGTRYFGPYAHAWAIRETVDQLLRVFPVRTCSNGVFKRARQSGRPCLLGYIDKCSAPCVGAVDAEEHRALAEDFCDFMAGQTQRFVRRLERAMHAAAEELDFERAARLRDDIAALNRALERNAVVLPDGTDADVFALAEDDLEAAVQVFHVRGGRVRGQRGWVVEKVEDVTTADLVEHLLQQVYGDLVATAPEAAARAAIPREVLVPVLPDHADQLEQWLSGRRGARVAVRVPQRGDKRALLQTVDRNAAAALTLHKTRRAGDLTTRSVALQEIQDALDLPTAPLRIECYDVSNISGQHVVASMVVFEDGLARKSEYRRFIIRGDGRSPGAGEDLDGTSGPDDVAAVYEVITRRFRRYLEGQQTSAGPGPWHQRRRHPWRRCSPGGRRSRCRGRHRPAPTSVRLPTEPGRRGRRCAPGGCRRPGPVRARRRRRSAVRPGQAAGGGVAAGRRRPCHPAPKQPGPVPVAAGPRRGASVRDRPPPATTQQGDDRQRAGRGARAGAGPQTRPPQGVRLAETAAHRGCRADRCGAGHRPDRGSIGGGRAGRARARGARPRPAGGVRGAAAGATGRDAGLRHGDGRAS